MTERENDLLSLILDKIEYDFCEDDDDVQGTWSIYRDENYISIAYEPFSDSPFPATTMRYRFERLS